MQHVYRLFTLLALAPFLACPARASQTATPGLYPDSLRHSRDLFLDIDRFFKWTGMLQR